jgi:hypothetical protein
MITGFMNTGQTAGFGVPGREGDRDGRLREVFLSNGQVALLEAKDPYGMWHIRMKEGKTPYELKDALFTTPSSAELAVVRYFNDHKFNVSVVADQVEPPVLPRKSDNKHSNKAV